jgi:hypothetical protein
VNLDASGSIGGAAGAIASGLRPSRAALPAGARRAIVHGLVVAGLLFAGYLFLVSARAVGTFGYDAYAYWSVDPNDPYGIPHGEFGSFVYAPAVAQVMSVFGRLPWWQFLWLWTALLVATVIWMGRSRVLLLFAFPPVAVELYYGNVHLLLAAAVVLGFAHPWTWAFVLLTKVTPGVGLAWFAVRREWRSLAVALGATACVVAVSWLLDPAAWAGWASLLAAGPAVTTPNGGLPVPLLVRLPIAIALIAWGARTDRRWTLATGALLALPVIWLTSLAMLAALVPLARGAWGSDGVGRVARTSGTHDPDH